MCCLSIGFCVFSSLRYSSDSSVPCRFPRLLFYLNSSYKSYRRLVTLENVECRNSEPKPEYSKYAGTPGMTEKIENIEIN